MLQVIIGKLNDETRCPADRIAEADKERRVRDKVRNHEEVNLPDPDKGSEHDDHRAPGVTAAPECGSQYVIHTVEKQEEGICVDKQCAGIDHTLIF